MSMLNTMLVVAWKETLDLSRDKRSIMNVFVMGALFGPLLAMGLLFMSQRLLIEETDKLLTIPAAGIQHAPELVRHLEQYDIRLREVGDLESRVAEQLDEVALRIPDNFHDRVRSGQPAVVEVIFDGVRTKSKLQRQRLQNAVNAWASRVGNLRLLARGVDPSVTLATQVRGIDVNEGNIGASAPMLSLIPYFLILGLIQASMFIASDVTAGERERQSLEPLLVNPVPPGQIMAGKLLVNVVTCLAVVLISASSFVFGTTLMAIDELGLVIDPLVIPQVLLALMPLVLVIAPLMTFLGAFAKSVREAQTYLTVVILIALLPTIMQMTLQARIVGWQLSIPLWSQNFLVNELFRGVTVPTSSWLYSAAGSLLLGAVFTMMALQLYRQPRLIFND